MFLMQCKLQFRDRPGAFDGDDAAKVNFAISYLQNPALQWFEPRLSGELDEDPAWLEDWELFVEELQTNFGPYDQTGDAESELVSLKMTSGQRITESIVRFNSLAPRCDWGDAALRHRFYEGLPNRLKDEVSRGDGKPRDLHLMRLKAQNADARYWERQTEKAHEANTGRSDKAADNKSSNNNSNNTSNSNDKKSDGKSNKGQRQSGQASGSAAKTDLTGKLGSNGKLTQQERQRRIDSNLCLFCGKGGHRVTDCMLTKANSSKARAVTMTSVDSESKDKKSADVKKEKQPSGLCADRGLRCLSARQ
jgi:hypothetical protein